MTASGCPAIWIDLPLGPVAGSRFHRVQHGNYALLTCRPIDARQHRPFFCLRPYSGFAEVPQSSDVIDSPNATPG
ncbi:hypothetical protein M407DRAFT_242374 [Tulasnella calospora MUT 4182]|uniref:Uncharacterized protein n=1 Tax=Tulasnella calospora MUT 4182 TaxID=1051891 RepID=A0A0C3LX64_9AGAM|nr:hypothetical protein M407DRAFT_243890 [Tulasnella calospora MUT 4182]KIO30025.1 hypothetical protein M407DRAFT_242374 [Tulasnella calospora MUT 4182]